MRGLLLATFTKVNRGVVTASTIDWRIVAGGNYNEPSFPNGWTPQDKSVLNLFLYFFLVVNGMVYGGPRSLDKRAHPTIGGGR